MSPRPTALKDRVFAQIAPPDANGCRIWRGTLRPNGYPNAVNRGGRGTRKVQPARVVYEEMIGSLTADVHVELTCGRPACCAPEHLIARTFTERLLAGIAPADGDGCRLWTGSVDTHGYGHLFRAGRLVLAHRAAYEHFIGPIPVGLVLDHVVERGCMHRTCCNPAHLEPVTSAENIRRGAVARKEAA